MPKSEKPFDLDAEIRDLEAQLAEKKRARETAGETQHHDKELIREVLQERIQGMEKVTPETLQSQPQPPAQQTSGASFPLPVTPTPRDLKEKEHEQQIEVLVEVAMAKGIPEAVTLARQLNNPHILDDFHDALVDEYYEKLVALRTRG